MKTLYRQVRSSVQIDRILLDGNFSMCDIFNPFYMLHLPFCLAYLVVQVFWSFLHNIRCQIIKQLNLIEQWVSLSQSSALVLAQQNFTSSPHCQYLFTIYNYRKSHHLVPSVLSIYTVQMVNNLLLHCYADDTSLYLQNFINSLSGNVVQLNESK